MKKITLIASLTAALLVGAAAARAADAAELWAKNCASCHGKDGAGHTKAGKMVGAKDLTDAAYQNGFSDEKAFAELKDGMKGSDGKTKMRPFAEKLSDADLKALVAYVRSLQK